MNNHANTIQAFWQLFSQHSADLEHMLSADDPIYTLLLERLHEISPDIFFEFMTSPNGNELVITADGERSLFPLVEEIIAAAPDSPDWTFFALKPQFGFPESTEWEGVQVRIADVRCILLECKDTNELGLELIVPRLNPAKEDALLNALLRAIDHGLGERRFAESIDFTELVDTPSAEGETFPLADLGAELDRHEADQ